MRNYLVVMDETDEAKIALRFASLRAARTGAHGRGAPCAPFAPTRASTHEAGRGRAAHLDGAAQVGDLPRAFEEVGDVLRRV